MAKLDSLDSRKLKGEYLEITVTPPAKCVHGGYFKYMTPREVRCTKCNVGFYLEGADRLKDGHLYRGDRLII